MVKKTVQGIPIPPLKKRRRIIIDKNTAGLYNVIRSDSFTGERILLKVFKNKKDAMVYKKKH